VTNGLLALSYVTNVQARLRTLPVPMTIHGAEKPKGEGKL
jgi:hypothetical protein